MTVYENMAFGLRLRKTPKDQINARVQEVADQLGLQELLKRKPGQLSGGQRQRVALGRAIAREPQVYLMDEPLSNLDAKLRVQTRAELIKLHRRLNVTTVYVTHDQVEAMTMGPAHRRDARRFDPAVRHADGAVSPSGQYVRRRFHRHALDELSGSRCCAKRALLTSWTRAHFRSRCRMNRRANWRRGSVKR